MTAEPIVTRNTLQTGIGRVEDVATLLERHGLEDTLHALALSGIGRATEQITVHMTTTSATIRAARLLFGTNNPPTKATDVSLLAYEGQAGSLGKLHVFGPSNSDR